VRSRQLPVGRPSRLTIAALAALSCTGHVLYPAWLAYASRGRRPATPPDPPSWPALTVLVPAYKEAGCIEAKVRDVLANGYAGPLEVMVVADGDPETAERAEQAGATVVSAPERLGKAQAVNLGFSKVTTPVVVLSDANNVLSPGALAALVRHLEDPSVGAVAGSKVEDDGRGEDLYWRFESWLKAREWALGSTIGLVGELAAIRTDAWEPIPSDIAIDDLWVALDLAARGYRVAYEPEALAHEPPLPSVRGQWERRTRNVAGGLHVFARRRGQLGPGGGLAAVEIWGHRLGRYTVVPLSHLALLAVALRRLRRSRLAQLFVAGHVVGVVTLARDASPGDASPGGAPSVPTRIAQVLAKGVFLDAVALGGLARYARGDRPTRWATHRR